MKNLTVLLAIFFFSFSNQLAFAEDDEDIYYKVLSEHLSCLFEYKDEYLKLDDDLLAIEVHRCPEVVVDLKSALENFGPDLSLEGDDTRSHDRFIMITKDELRCLSEATPSKEADVLFVYPTDCQIQTSRKN